MSTQWEEAGHARLTRADELLHLRDAQARLAAGRSVLACLSQSYKRENRWGGLAAMHILAIRIATLETEILELIEVREGLPEEVHI